MHQLFQVLNTPEDQRQKALDDALADFPYVNGRLFKEILPVASFDGKMRAALLNCAELDWSKISPAVFGALFQSVMDEKARRNLGAHYTREKNILKVIKPLFMDRLPSTHRHPVSKALGVHKSRTRRARLLRSERAAF